MAGTTRGWMAGFGLLAATAAGAVDYAGSGIGAIPDNNASGINITFNTSGFQGPIRHVRVSLNLTHTFAGDLRATLSSPGGVAQLVLFSRVGYKRAAIVGSSANLSGAYVFDDLLGADLWAAVAPLSTAQNVPTGAYRTSTAGAVIGAVRVSDFGGCSTHLDLAFGGLAAAQASGIWTLNIADAAAGDTGSVNSATLTLEQTDLPFASGFESAQPGPAPVASAASGSCKKALFDYTGDGRSDFATVRNTGGGQGGAITWSVLESTGSSGGATQTFGLGISTDNFLDGDFDGDGIADGVVWRASEGLFYVRRSSRPLDAPLAIALGAVGDNPRHVGDYDGDNVADATVYRAGATAGATSSFIIRLSSNGQLRTLVAGENGAFPSAGIDLNGDNRADVSVQSNAGGGAGRFRLFDGTSGFNFLDTNFGTPTDLVVTGNHAGNARGDITVVRGVGGVLNWTTREAISGTAQPVVLLGASATDFVLTGDYDGDGLDDHAVWRPSQTPGESRFIVRRSTSVAVPLEVPAGQNGDYPVANARIN